VSGGYCKTAVSRCPFSQTKIKMEEKIKALEANLEQTKAKLHVAVKALEDVKKWDDDLEYEWGDPGERASRALDKIAMLDGF